MFVYITDIIESMDAIEEYIKGLNDEKFEANYLAQDAVMMRLSIIGESTAKLILEFRKNHPNIPWRSMKAVRNLIVHDYASVNLKKIWEIVSKDLPTTKKQIVQIIPSV